jgi:O-antigen ligase
LSTLAISWRRGDWRQQAIAGAALGLAVLIGAALAISVKYGLALLLACCFGLLLWLSPVWALIAFVPLVFLDAIPALNLAGKAVGLILAAAWIGAALTRRMDVIGGIARFRHLFECLVALLIWFLLTALWAADSGRVVSDIWHWVSVALLFAIVSTWITDERKLTWFCGAFVFGAVLSVLVGAGLGTLGGGASAEARLEGGAGDPNFLAAGLVPAIVLAGGTIAATRNPLARLGCGMAIVICAIGIGAAQSHGGVLALLAVAVASLFVFRNRRTFVVLACLCVVAVGAVYFTLTPDAWQRITHVEEGGSGRTDLWSVAWRATEAHPLEGVGLHNYEVVAKEYTRQPGSLSSVNKIAEKPHVVHNTYLEALAETGFIGAILFLLFALSCCYFAWRAGRRFEELGEPRLEALAQAVLVALIGMMVASIFISAGVDRRLWILFALGPAMLAIAERRAAGRPRLNGAAAEGGRSAVPIPSGSVPGP